jgi:hypothetical protein
MAPCRGRERKTAGAAYRHVGFGAALTYLLRVAEPWTQSGREQPEKISEAVDALFDVVMDARPGDRPPVLK